mmetsp:Transcript_25600/g.82899  ORF Transcript_25600/g.82899 Transcript_25600/m.82899 type:complete len:249 (+) Transcript_25600:344-1090(+)
MRGVCGRRRSGRWPGGRHQRREDEEGRSRFASATVDFPPDRCHRHLEVWEDVFARHGGRIVESFHLVSSSALSTVDGDGLVEGIDDPAEVDAVVHVVRQFCCDVAAFYGRAAREELSDELRSCTVKCRLARHLGRRLINAVERHETNVRCQRGVPGKREAAVRVVDFAKILFSIPEPQLTKQLSISSTRRRVRRQHHDQLAALGPVLHRQRVVRAAQLLDVFLLERMREANASAAPFWKFVVNFDAMV